ncbi:hypothetical protein BUALT_Bualt15G0017900 [Buddleja alternifolia]|uniref:Uncharacterized protein n=1 Tax=Buddleja alternifolia TaxID=168488 RepID=A0AAV6WKZ5_9LAMI|nr:hypothetical protein BUALT_Bualt15G0017900 [Buddleja alternifolia]
MKFPMLYVLGDVYGNCVEVYAHELCWKMLSPEDVAWADSCLTKDPDSLDSGWNSLKDALLQTLTVEHDSSAHEKDNSVELAKTEIFSSTETDNIKNSNKTEARIVTNGEGAEQNSDDNSNHENTDDFWSKHSMENVFLPTYNEESRDIGALDPEMDFVFQEFELEQSTEDIFKIWDLDIPPEEDDLIKQLNKALAENSSESTTPVPDDSSKAWKGLKDVSLGDLISGMADLSLSPNSG